MNGKRARDFIEENEGKLIEHRNPRIGSEIYYWPSYDKRQLKSCDELIHALINEYEIIGIASHEEIDTRGWKTDPGPAFPMHAYKKLFSDNEYEVAASSLNVRLGPGMKYPIVGSLSNGYVVHASDQIGDWMGIGNGKYVHGSYLKSINR